MPTFRRRTRATTTETVPARGPAFAVTVEDLQVLERVTGHARTQLARHADARDLGVVDEASGYWLMLTLSERAGAARALGHAGIPMLVEEVETVRAVVLNLESYGGATMALAEGYELLDRITLLSRLPCSATPVGGVLTLPGETPEVGALSAT
ncbi:hypothetical protein HTV80_05820 [Streptomyces sp. Vc74B-19]|uniref:hypothetical protein n=1 Tax=unclassified Streptomyces TaxID=2593676 RepID=UPI001BFC7B2D|nr:MULTISPECIES: hypothetical protein [unclassified Streptomyces]MBT3162625.1 hypothetical protein [Streptomyces sp. Vc74B-19]